MRCRPSRSLLPVLALSAVLALGAPRLADAQAAAPADAQAPATTYYAYVVSRPVVAVGNPVLLILAPAGGPWPSGVAFTPFATGLQGAFTPASALGASSAPVLFVFIPSAPGGGTISAANTAGMIEALPPESQAAMSPGCLAARQLVGGIPA